MKKWLAVWIENLLEFSNNTLRLFVTPPQYQDPGKPLELTPDEFYAGPWETPQLTLGPWIGRTPGRRWARFHFSSPVQSPYPQNNQVTGLVNRPSDGHACGAIIFLHGYQMNTPVPLQTLIQPAASSGFEVYLPELPYHMHRAPKGTWSGQYSVSANLQRTQQSFRQGVMDVRALISWIEAERGLPVVLAGISMGAFTACMVTTVDERPRAVLSLLGGGSFAQVPFSGYPLRYIRNELTAHGVSLADLERHWALMAPARWKPRLPKERYLLIAGEHDTIVTPSNVRRLWKTWGHPQLLWYPCGHITLSNFAIPVGQDMARWLEEQKICR